MLFDNWAGIGRVLLVGTLAYGALVFVLRVSGKRTLTKLNAFDLIVTIALGSTLASILLNKDVALAEGVVALSLLVSLQALMSWLAVRSPRFRSLLKSEPTLLLRNGVFLDDAMRRQRITSEEILAALRADGTTDAGQAAAVILETDGSISVIPRPRRDS